MTRTIMLVSALVVGMAIGYLWNYAQHRIPSELAKWTVRAPDSAVALYCPQWRATLYGKELYQEAGGVAISLLGGENNMIHIMLLPGTYSEDLEPQAVAARKIGFVGI